MTYRPAPMDTSDVQLPRELEPLLEELARNTHENWAQGRLDAGWRYGPVRDDAKLLHPCLVPYEQLSETEKDFDRVTCMEALKAIIKLGFRIVKDE